MIVRGTGSIGMRHLNVLRQRLGVGVIAAPVRASRLAELQLLGFTNPLLGSAQMAVIATDTSRHLEDAAEAIRAGCHVLIEKPIAPTATGLRSLGEFAVGHGRKIFVACCLRFDAGLQLIRAQLPQIGAIHSVRIECQSYLPDWRPERDYRLSYSARRDEGGVLRDLVHEIDYAVWLFGRPKAVSARLENTGRLGIEAEESADLLWRAPGRSIVSIRLDYLTRTPSRRMLASGERGELEWDAIAKQVTVRCFGQPEQVIRVVQERDEMMADQAVAFLRACAGGDPGDLATFEDGAWAMAICDAARRSSESGASEDVSDWRCA